MKKTIKVLGVIALAATMMFAMTGCAPDGNLDGSEVKTPQMVIKTVAVGTQHGILVGHAGGYISFPVTTANIADGSYDATVANLPSEVQAWEQVTIIDNSGTLRLSCSNMAEEDTISTLTLTIDGTTSAAFTLTIVNVAPPGSYTVTVNNFAPGSGDTASFAGASRYMVGATVTITAGTPSEGRKFGMWESLYGGPGNLPILVNASSPTTTFTMPAQDVTIQAKFVSISQETYAVTVNNGTGSGNYLLGGRVYIAATVPTGHQFENWTTSAGVTFDDANNASTTFTMLAQDVTVTANFVPTYAVTVTGGSGSGSYVANAIVSITATVPTGHQFVNWTTTSAGVTFANANNTTTTFTMPAHDVTVMANFTPIVSAVTVTGGNGSDNYPYGATVTITAMPPIGQQFVNWTTTSENVTFANANNTTTTFTMPAHAVTVTANFTPIYALGDTGPGGGIIYHYNADGFTVEGYGNPGDAGYFATYTAYYLEATPTTTAIDLRWTTSIMSYYPNITGTSTVRGTGRKNTALILASDATAPAARACTDVTTGGKNDWFLPSQAELYLLTQQRNLPGINIPIGTGISYWSSSQVVSTDTYEMRAYSVGWNGGVSQETKNKEYYVRAIRAF